MTLGVEGRDLGHVADDIALALNEFGERLPDGNWAPVRPRLVGLGPADP